MVGDAGGALTKHLYMACLGHREHYIWYRWPRFLWGSRSTKIRYCVQMVIESLKNRSKADTLKCLVFLISNPI
jgi:hypothetical protein